MDTEHELAVVRAHLQDALLQVRRRDAMLADLGLRVRDAEAAAVFAQRQVATTERACADLRQHLTAALTRIAVLEAGPARGHAPGRATPGTRPASGAGADAGNATSAAASDAAAAASAPAAGTGGKPKPPSFVKPNRRKKGEERPPKKRTPRGRAHNTSRRAGVATDTVVHRLETCPVCDTALVWPHVARRVQVTELPEAMGRAVVTDHVVSAGYCPRCQRPRTAVLDRQTTRVGQGRFGPRLVAHIAYLRQRMRLPVQKIRELLATAHGVCLSAGGIVGLLARVAQRVEPAAAAILEEIQAAPAMNADETSLREDGQNGWMWMVRTKTAIYYRFELSRAGAVADALIGPWYTGMLTTDFYCVYQSPTCRHQRCWAHLLRDVKALAEARGEEPGVRRWCAAVRALFRHAVTAGKHRQGQAGYDRLVRQARVLGRVYASTPNHPCRVLCERLLKYRDELFLFVLYPDLVEPTNNLAERAMRHIAVIRKISGGTRSPSGSRTLATLATVFGTWAARGLHTLQACYEELIKPPPRADDVALAPSLPTAA